MKVAFIGVGAIGLPMAKRLLPAHDVVAYDISSERVAQLVELGASSAPDVGAAVRDAELVIVMVATPDQLRAVVYGPDGMVGALRPHAIVVVMSSVGVEAVVEIGEQLGAGIRVLDVPVTGGVVRATTGELTLFAGGDDQILEAARPVLELLGNNIAVCGPNLGDGQAVKLVNQLLCSVHLVAAAEALKFAEFLGLDPARVLATIGSGGASSFMLNDRGARMLGPQPIEALSAIDIFVKDSQLVKTAAASVGAQVPLLEAAAEKFLQMSEGGFGRVDDSIVIQAFGSPHQETANR